MTYAVYIAAFLVASCIIATASWFVWHAIIRAMPSPPHWMDAFRLVWCDVYGVDWDKRPRVIFVWGQSFEHNGKQCAGLSDYSSITVAIPHGKFTQVSDTAFAHELWHQARLLKGMGHDPEHKAADWVLVAVANRGLRERGW